MDHYRTSDGVRYSLLADAANFSIDGKVSVLGEFNTIHSDEPNATWSRMFYVAKVEIPASESGVRQYEMRIMGPDGSPRMPPHRGEIEVPESDTGDSRFVALILEIRGLQLAEYGAYSVELWRIDESPRQIDAFALYFRPTPG